MKPYRVWILALLVFMLLLGFSTIAPNDSKADRIDNSLIITGREELLSVPHAQSNESSQIPKFTRNAPSDDYSGKLQLNVERRNHTATSLADGRVIIIGGDNPQGVVSEAEMLDTSSQTLSVITKLLVPRSKHTATLLADGRVMVAGGWNQKDRFNSTEIFNPQTNSFSRGPGLQTPRAAHCATVLENGQILFTGGTPDASAEIFDPVTQRTTLLKSRMTAARSFHTAILLGDGNVLIVGGVDQDGYTLRSAEIFDSRTQTFSPTVAPMSIKRVHATLRGLADGKVQIIGGDYDGTMEVYDPAKNQFSAAAHLTPTASVFPTSKILHSRTRAAFIDSKMTLDNSATVDPAKPLPHYSIANKKALDDFKPLLERAEYSSTEILGTNRAVITGGTGKAGEYMRSVVVVESSAAAITTNKSEYMPGEHPVISGSGWQPHESIQIVRQEARPGHKRKYLEVVADELGNFTTAGIALTDFRQGVTYTLSAMGEQSTEVAQTTYKDARLEAAKPENVKFNVPFLFRDASFEHEEGILIWDIRSGISPAARPPEYVAMSTSDTKTFDFADIIDKPCLGLSSCPLPSAFDIKMKSGSSLTVSSDFSGNTDCDGNTAGIQPCLQISESVNGKIILEITGNGDIDLPAIPIPGASISAMLSIGGIVDIGVTLGIVAKPSLEFTDPGTTIQTTLNISQSVTISFPSSNPVSGNLDPSVDFKLVDTAGGCLKIAIGPEVKLEGGVTIAGCEIGASGAVFAGPFVKGCFNISDLNTCPQYSIPISVGLNTEVEGELKFCASIGTSYSADLLEATVATFTGTLNDTTPPTITPPANITQGTDSGMCGATVNFTPTASDGSCPTPTIVCTPASGSFFNKGTSTVNCEATDGGGNKASGSFTVTVNDTQAPTVNCAGNITQATDNNACSAVVSYASVATDACDGAVTPSCTPPSGSAFAKGVTTVSCSATDAAGNQSSPCTFTVTVNDTQKPQVSCPGNITQGTDNNQCSAMVSLPATATDNCDTKLAPTCTPPSNSVFPKGTTTVTCSATDAAGNQSSSCSFTVTINDTQKPAISTPASVTQGTDANKCSAVVTYTATATDNCDATVVPSCTPPSGSTFNKGVTTVTCSASDTAKNSASRTFPVTINDVQKPQISCSGNIVVPTVLDTCSAPVSFASSATDNCAVASVVCLPPSGTTFPKGVSTVTCTATDTSANSTACSFTVTVNDVQKPAIFCPPNLTRLTGRPGDTTILVNYQTTATDNCAIASIVCTPPAGTAFPVGTTAVNCTATDTSSNSSVCNFMVTVFDICIQDDSNPAIVIFVNSATGDYRYCCNGTIYTGRGTIGRKGSTFTLVHNATDRRISASVDSSTNRGSSTIQSAAGTLLCAINDRDIRNNSCQCQ